MKLKELFEELIERIGFSKEIVNHLWLDLEKVYSSKSRYYHDLNHLKEMIDMYHIHYSNLQFPDEVLFSIFYHDYVYKVTRKDNEQKSAEHALSILSSDIQLNKQLVFDMICATQLHQYNKNEDINWLIDFDLKILSKDWEAYQIYCQQIRKEYKIYPDFLYNPGRKKALAHFLKNKNIYQTETFRTLFEDKARENIQKEIATL